MAKKNKTENLPVVAEGQSFALTVSDDMAIQLNPELAGEIDATDFEGYDSTREALPIASIRQKPLNDDKTGSTLFNPGGFKIYDPVTADSDRIIPDQESLTLTILADQPSRIYWPQGEFDKPHCRSNDAKMGIGDPGGNCSLCPKAQFINGERPECTSQMNCLVYDYGLKSCYILRLGRSGLRPYGNFRAAIKRIGNGMPQPLHAFRIVVTTKYEKDPAPHYTPVFQIEGQPDIELFRELKQIRREYNDAMQRTVRVDTDDEEHPVNDTPTSDELPPGAEPVERANKDGDELPF